jgi:hypothetical protein
MHIIGIDPGETTGLCQYVEDAFHFYELTGEHHLALWKFLDTGGAPDVVVCERFDNRGNQAAVLTALEYIGVVKLWTQMETGRKLHLQSASEGKSFWTDEKLERLEIVNLPKRTPRHKRDAMRHILHYMQARQGDLRFIHLLRG